MAHPPAGRSRSRRLALLAASLGLTGLALQTLLLRELMAVWDGNEMALGLTLAVWLLAAGAGSAAARSRGLRRVVLPTRALPGLATLLALLGPSTVLLARLSRMPMGLSPGESAGAATIVLAAAASLVPYAFLTGLLFVLTVAAGDTVHRHSARAGPGPEIPRGDSVSRVYILESAGAAVAGLLLSFILLGHLTALQTSFVVAVPLLLASLGLGTGLRRLAPALLTIVFVLMTGPWGEALDRFTIGLAWKGLGLVASSESVYGRVTATRLGSQESLYATGVLVASTPDLLAAEESVHVPLLQHPAPARVLLLGGGLGGAAHEVLSHPDVREVDYVELDPLLVATARNALGSAMTAGLEDARVRTHFMDGRRFIKQRVDAYDVIIVGLPDPTTVQLNRFYTMEFFSEARRALRRGGVLGLSVTSSENYISPELSAMLATLERTLAAVFHDTALLPGDPCHVIGVREPGAVVRTAGPLVERIERRQLETRYVRGYYLRDRLSPARVAALDSAVGLADDAHLNRDLRPVMTLHVLSLWSRRFARRPGFAARALSLVGLPVFWVAGAAIAGLAGASAVRAALRRRRSTPTVAERATPDRSDSTRLARSALRRSVVTAVAVVGLTEMSIEVSALAAYQSLFGFVYGRMALITAAFMAGLALGGAAGARAVRRGAGPAVFLRLQSMLAVLPLVFGAAALVGPNIPPEGLELWKWVFPLLVVASALLAGAQFPLAASMLTRADVGRADSAGERGGQLYAADLAGAAVGAGVTAVFLIPVLGIMQTMVGMTILNLCVLGPLWLSTRPGRAKGPVG